MCGNGCSAPDPETFVTQTFPFLMWSSWPHGPGGWMTQLGWITQFWDITKSMSTELQLFAQISAGFGSASQKKSLSAESPSPKLSLGNICKHFSTFIAMLPVHTEIHSDFPFLQGCLSSFSCLGLQEIETEGLRPPARDFVSQCSGALYGWMMNTNLIILGSPGWVFFS